MTLSWPVVRGCRSAPSEIGRALEMQIASALALAVGSRRCDMCFVCV